MVEKQVSIKVIRTNLDVHLLAEKRETFAELKEKLSNVRDEGMLEMAFVRKNFHGQK
jgi:hypothetical protein